MLVGCVSGNVVNGVATSPYVDALLYDAPFLISGETMRGSEGIGEALMVVPDRIVRIQVLRLHWNCNKVLDNQLS